MNKRKILHIVLFVIIATSLLISGCSIGDNSSQQELSRRIKLEGQKNFRDLGGYENIYGQSTRWRMLFRSGDLYDLTDADLSIVNNLGLRLVIDFRSEEEIDERPDRLPAGARSLVDSMNIEGVNELFNNVLQTGDTSQLTVDNIADIYKTIYTDKIEQFNLMLSEVINNENRPVLIHCRGGNDRTGFNAALILHSLQITDEVIINDYLLSNEYLKDTVEESLDYFSKTIEQNTGNTPTEEDMERIRNLLEAKREYMESAFQNVVDKYGTFENYIVNGLEIAESDIKEFRNQVLVP
ncbi:MAG: tyrosine-protein phosphatase [Candidatus Eremiobacteraeota bacterium]|nr:tyrosine-protein phosphatase [Candidatus Eremiobacteraeota bacterium]